MYRRHLMVGLFAVALAAAGCGDASRTDAEITTATEQDQAAERAAERQRERDAEIARLDERAAALDRDYAEKAAATPRHRWPRDCGTTRGTP